MIIVKPTIPQFAFCVSPYRFPAMVAGYGSGKTFAGILRAITYKLKYPTCDFAYYLPTYDLISRIAFPRFEEMLNAHDIPFEIQKSEKIIDLFGKGKFILRTMDKPERIIGYEVADSLADELDTLPLDKAADVWRKIVARNRQKKPDGSANTIGVATTPEGFRFVYENWKRIPMNGTKIIQASTESNAENLPADYVQTLRDTYPDQMLDAYINGEFVNMTTGSVYSEFDRVLNGCNTVVEADDHTLHIGVDFNVGKMSAAVHVLRDGYPHCVDEFADYLDTPDLIHAIKQKYHDKSVYVYPDASGASRKSQNASESDIAQLEQAGFNVCAEKKNPFIKDRVAAVNKIICKFDERWYKVNSDNCPKTVEGLEKQAYDKNGVPDKDGGFDHMNDAIGYFIAYRYPILYGQAVQTKLKGF